MLKTVYFMLKTFYFMLKIFTLSSRRFTLCSSPFTLCSRLLLYDQGFFMSFNIKPSFRSLITICTRKHFYILYKHNIFTKFTSSLRRLSFTPFEYIVKQREPGNQGNQRTR